jgi:predicted restriction endonuclease
MRKEKSVICKECKKEFKTKWGSIFCSHSCSAISSNRNRPPNSEKSNKKRSESLKKYYAEHPERTNPERNRRGIEYSKFIGSYTKGKFKGAFIESILSVSKRTASKILKRLNVGCCICGWKEASCDIHHINGKKVENPNGHWNLTCICPNHHRMFHNKKISKDKFISLDKYFPENWRDVYYG